MSLHRACLEAAFRPTLEAIRADLEAVAEQHGSGDPVGVAAAATRRRARELVDLLQRLRADVAASSLEDCVHQGLHKGED